MQSGFIDAHNAAKILGCCARHVIRMFKQGKFETAHQITIPRGWWRVSRHEVISKRMSQQHQQLYD